MISRDFDRILTGLQPDFSRIPIWNLVFSLVLNCLTPSSAGCADNCTKPLLIATVPLTVSNVGVEKCAQTSFAQTFSRPPGVRDIPANILGHPRFPPSKAEENKLLREGANFLTTTPLSGTPPPHAVVSGPQKNVFLKGFFTGVYASLGCGALSAKCTAGTISLGSFESWA